MPRRLSEGSHAKIRRCPHSNTQIIGGSIYAMWKMSVNECAIIRTQSMTGIGCWRNILEVRLVLRLSFEPGQPFCHTQPVKGNMLQVYIRKPPVTAFDANSYYILQRPSTKLAWVYKFVATWFSPFPYRIHTNYLPGFFRADTCGKSKQVSLSVGTGKPKKPSEKV